VNCGLKFRPNAPHQRFCSTACAKKTWARRQAKTVHVIEDVLNRRLTDRELWDDQLKTLAEDAKLIVQLGRLESQ
jgi:hypothetical protein